MILKETNPGYSLKRLLLKLKLQYSGRLMRRADSLEKTWMLGKTEGERRKGQQRMRWLDSITDSMDMDLSKLWKTVEERGAWRDAAHGVRVEHNLLTEWQGEDWRWLKLIKTSFKHVFIYIFKPTESTQWLGSRIPQPMTSCLFWVSWSRLGIWSTGWSYKCVNHIHTQPGSQFSCQRNEPKERKEIDPHLLSLGAVGGGGEGLPVVPYRRQSYFPPFAKWRKREIPFHFLFLFFF